MQSQSKAQYVKWKWRRRTESLLLELLFTQHGIKPATPMICRCSHVLSLFARSCYEAKAHQESPWYVLPCDARAVSHIRFFSQHTCSQNPREREETLQLPKRDVAMRSHIPTAQTHAHAEVWRIVFVPREFDVRTLDSHRWHIKYQGCCFVSYAQASFLKAGADFIVAGGSTVWLDVRFSSDIAFVTVCVLPCQKLRLQSECIFLRARAHMFGGTTTGVGCSRYVTPS